MEEKVDIESTPTGITGIPEEIKKQIVEAEERKDLSALMRLTGIPGDVIIGARVMSRKERRKWYRDNKARLKLPKWGELESLTEK